MEEKEYRLYILSGDTTLHSEFITDDIMDSAIDQLESDTLEEMLMQVIDGLNNDTLSAQNWYILYHKSDYMTVLSNFPTQMVDAEEEEKPDGHW